MAGLLAIFAEFEAREILRGANPRRTGSGAAERQTSGATAYDRLGCTLRRSRRLYRSGVAKAADPPGGFQDQTRTSVRRILADPISIGRA